MNIIERIEEQQKKLKEEINQRVVKEKNYYPNADEKVLQFIYQFVYTNLEEFGDESVEMAMYNRAETMYDLFKCGYCYYFAIMLKAAFNRGQICWAAPLGHIVWVDDDGVPYDIDGVNDSECEYYIPTSYIKEAIVDFKHVPGEEFNASLKYINDAIARYKKDNNID